MGVMVKERGAHSARIKALLIAHGIRLEKIPPDFIAQLADLKSAIGYDLGKDLTDELKRDRLSKLLFVGPLFNSNRLGQIPGLIHIRSFDNRHIVRQ